MNNKKSNQVPNNCHSGFCLRDCFESLIQRFKNHIDTPHSIILFKQLGINLFIWTALCVFLIALASFLPIEIFFLKITGYHHPSIDHASIFLTEYFIYAIFIGFLGLSFWRLIKNTSDQVKYYALTLAVVFSEIITQLLKKLFSLPRPYEVMSFLDPVVEAATKSFPSGHATFAFSMLFPIFKISKKWGWIYLIIAILVSLSRIYQFVHYPLDIATGIFIGGFAGIIFANAEIQRFLTIAWKHLEFRRQTFHFTLGFLVVFAHWAGFLRIREIAVILFVGLIISMISIIKKDLPIISELLQRFDRKRAYDFPGSGAFYFFLGVLLCFILFPVKIAYASILIMSVGDSLNHLFVRNIGCAQVPWNRKKNWVGVGLGIASGIFVASFFVPIWAAVIATVIAIILETITLKIGPFFLDDNLVVPLSAGGILKLLEIVI